MRDIKDQEKLRDFNFRFILNKRRESKFNEKLIYCLNRVYRHLIFQGKPVGGVYHVFFQYDKKIHVFGSFVISHHNKFIFFPGSYPMIFDTCKSPIDHITLDTNLSSIHFKMMDRNEQIPAYPAYLFEEEVVLWITLIVDEIKKYPILTNPGFKAKVPSNDYERRKNEIEKSIRKPFILSLDNMKINQNDAVAATILISKKSLNEKDLVYYNHLGIVTDYKKKNHQVRVLKIKNKESQYDIYTVFSKVEWMGIGKEPPIRCYFLKKRS